MARSGRAHTETEFIIHNQTDTGHSPSVLAGRELLGVAPLRHTTSIVFEESIKPEALHIEWVDSADDIPLDLWRICFPPPLEGMWYYQAIERGVHASRMRFAYGIIHMRERMLGIVPTFTVDVPIAMGMPPKTARFLHCIEALAPNLMRTKTLFVGSPTSVQGTIGLRPEVDTATVIPAVAAALEHRAKTTRAHLIAWKGFPSPSNTPFELLSSSLGFEPIHDFPETVMSVPPSWEAYLTSLNAKRRYALRKKLQHSHNTAPLETSVVQSPDAATLEEVYALYKQTHQRVKNHFMLLTPSFFKHMAHSKAAHFVLLREPLTGSLVAFMLCFIIGSRAINRFTGLEYLVARPWNLHFRLWEAALRFMISLGVTEVYSGQTTYRFKVDTGHDLVPMTIYTKHRNPIIHRFLLPIMRETMKRTVWTER